MLTSPYIYICYANPDLFADEISYYYTTFFHYPCTPHSLILEDLYSKPHMLFIHEETPIVPLFMTRSIPFYTISTETSIFAQFTRLTLMTFVSPAPMSIDWHYPSRRMEKLSYVPIAPVLFWKDF